MDTSKLKDLIPVDSTGNFEKSYSVFIEQYPDPDDPSSQITKAWDCYLTKVDLKNGPYGCFVFYKI